MDTESYSIIVKVKCVVMFDFEVYLLVECKPMEFRWRRCTRTDRICKLAGSYCIRLSSYGVRLNYLQ